MVLSAGLREGAQLVCVVRVLDEVRVLQLVLSVVLYEIRWRLRLGEQLVALMAEKLLQLNALMLLRLLLKMNAVLLSVLGGRGCAGRAHVRVVGSTRGDGPFGQHEIALRDGAAVEDGPVGREGLARRPVRSLETRGVDQRGPHHMWGRWARRVVSQQFGLVAAVHVRLALALLGKEK